MTAAPGDLSDAERRVWEAYRNGEQCVFGVVAGPTSSDWPLPDADTGRDWGPNAPYAPRC